ncbi:methyltransferase, TIGR04325 family [Marinobacter sp. F4206]|uniref:methyltransferase, TIGR04325 family n=1 Tax=Marinobacter sp. F4206 TaxID=2861777 RepID=UPI001C5D933C|nr:methyltransferase, TIGR04325 family [Marinobacter sp. F4206]MBW4936219.1 methyltransferase, TIGR04325 family [Marinobacter sp. F4206]
MFQRTKVLLHQVEQIPFINHALDRHYAKEFASATNVNWFKGVYPDFAAAIADAPASKPLGYDHDAPASAEMYRFRMQSISPCDYAVAFWLNRLMEPNQKLLDFGGHVGVLYYALKKYLTFPEPFEWQIFDVPAVIREARKFAAGNGNSGHLSFIDDLSQAAASDWVLFSGSLQYVEEPVSSIIERLPHRPTYILINMLPVHPREGYVTLQNISTAFCPYRIYSAAELLEDIGKLNGEVIDEWRNTDKECIIPYHEDHSLHYYRGMLVRLNSGH